MTQEESNRLAELLVRKEKADKLPTTERLKYIDKYIDIIAEILALEDKEQINNKSYGTLPLNIAIGFNNGLPYTNDSIDQYVWNQFKELCNSSSQSRKIMYALNYSGIKVDNYVGNIIKELYNNSNQVGEILWKLRAVQEVSYKLEEELK